MWPNTKLKSYTELEDFDNNCTNMSDVPSYKFITANRENKTGCGKMDCKIRKTSHCLMKTHKNLHSLNLKQMKNRESVVVGTLYRPPNGI